MERNHNEPKYIKVRGARVHNLKNVNVGVPLHQIVGIAGVSGSGKSSLALGVLYAEGSRRYLESLSTYTRRRMTGAAKAQVDEVLYVPAALALHQRPGIPGIRSTFGTGTELLNSLRLMYSRLASHRCPNGHYVPPTLKVVAEWLRSEHRIRSWKTKRALPENIFKDHQFSGLQSSSPLESITS